MILLDGKRIAAEIQSDIRVEIASFKGRPPCLAVILVGENPASEIYIKRKRRACEEVGIQSIYQHFPVEVVERDLLKQIRLYNEDPNVDGILVQLPLPSHISPQQVTTSINPNKDVDGFHPINMGKLLMGETDGFVPCTPLGIKRMLEKSGIDAKGKHAVVLGRSNIVGKPMAALLMQNTAGGNATVTVVNSFTKNVRHLCKDADILIAALGVPKFVTVDMVKEGCVVVDVGINKIANPNTPSGFQIVGDVDFENVQSKCSYITPVPGGVGPLTIAMLLQNTLKSYKNSK